MERRSNSKSNFCLTRNVDLSPLIVNNMGVNQGGIVSGFLFRKYMADLRAYLSREYGAAIADEKNRPPIMGGRSNLIFWYPTWDTKTIAGIKQFVCE